MIEYYEARAPEYDDWYLRRGRYARGAIHDAAWNAELDTAGSWLDGLPWSGEIVELAAGTGWWSPLLASRGELSLYDASPSALDRARERLVAHGLRAHLHVRDAWAEPDRAVDGLFLGFWLSHVPRERLADFLALGRRWLRSGGRLAFIDSLPDAASGANDHPEPGRRPGRPPARRRARVHDRQGLPRTRRAGRRAPVGRLRGRRDVHHGALLRARLGAGCLTIRPVGPTGRPWLYSGRCRPCRTPPSRPSAPASWPRR